MTTLSELIRKRTAGAVATAIHATPAIPAEELTEEVAKIATVAVANPDEAKAEVRHQRVLDMLAANPMLKYAVLVDDATTDPVLVAVGIRRLAVFDMQIPKANYDGIALLQVIEQFSAEANPLPEAKESSQAHPGEPQRKAA